MPMDALGYFNEVLKPCCERLRLNPYDRSLIISTAIVVYHAADWIGEETGNSISDVRKRIESRFPDFYFLGEVANMHKHRTRSDSRSRYKGLTNALTRPARLPSLSRNRQLLLTSKGLPVLRKTKPAYVFTDGSKKDPVALIDGSLKAIEAEFFRN